MGNYVILLYSGGCKVCRYVASIIHKWEPNWTIVPSRSQLGQDILALNGQFDSSRYLTWWVSTVDEEEDDIVLVAGNNGGIPILLSQLRYVRYLGLFFMMMNIKLNWIDSLVKRSRPLIANWIPDVQEVDSSRLV